MTLLETQRLNLSFIGGDSDQSRFFLKRPFRIIVISGKPDSDQTTIFNAMDTTNSNSPKNLSDQISKVNLDRNVGEISKRIYFQLLEYLSILMFFFKFRPCWWTVGIPTPTSLTNN